MKKGLFAFFKWIKKRFWENLYSKSDGAVCTDFNDCQFFSLKKYNL